MTRPHHKTRGGLSRIRSQWRAIPTKHGCETLRISFNNNNAYFKAPVSQVYAATKHEKPRLHPVKMRQVPEQPVSPPDAPRNTSSYIIKAKNSGGIVSVASTPSPHLASSSYKEDTVEEANLEWGVDSYGSMKGLLKFRETNDLNSFLDSGMESSTEACNNRLVDIDLSRFELLYPSGIKRSSIWEGTNPIASLKKENASLKEQMSCMEQELSRLKRRMTALEVVNSSPFRICSGESSFV
eukprot:TRINITY_DN2502_c0_g1_i3.p1 TRINITY_DN2502_c0_g1~~TRINITY_DN2502_c0_g1_i3.p1  ORF type:complete len:240 (+),score=15.83 TRINITY_DN2502_c0_g1_i3:469-1188(+)